MYRPATRRHGFSDPWKTNHRSNHRSMSKHATPDSTDSEQSFEPPFPENSRGYASVGDLQAHPRNEDIYADRENDELAARMQRVGFRASQRILVTPDGTILSGHRRWDAAKMAGIDEVPVEIVDLDPDTKEAEIELLTANTHREKTDVEKFREAEAWEELIHETSEDLEDVQLNKDSNPRQVATEKADMPESRYAKMSRVKRAADDGDVVAQEQWRLLRDEEQSVHGAYTAVREAEQDEEESDGDADSGGESTDEDTGSDDVDDDPDEGAESKTAESGQSTQQQGQQTGADGAGGEEEASNGEAEESASEGTGDGEGAEEPRISKLVEKVDELEEENQQLEERVEKVRRASADQAQTIFGLRFGDELSEDDVEELQERADEQQTVIGELNGKVEDLRSALKSLVDAVERKDDDDMGQALKHAKEVLK